MKNFKINSVVINEEFKTIGIIINKGLETNGFPWFRTDADGIPNPENLKLISSNNELREFKALGYHIAPSTEKLITRRYLLKSDACKEVLQLMDQDKTYSQAVKTVLQDHPRINRKQLENELDLYI